MTMMLSSVQGYTNSLMWWAACPAVPLWDTMEWDLEDVTTVPAMLPRPANRTRPCLNSTLPTATAAPRVLRIAACIARTRPAADHSVEPLEPPTAALHP